MKLRVGLMAVLTAAAIAIAMAPVAEAAGKKVKEPPPPIALPTPPPGKGQIVFFRPGGMGMAIGCSVNEHGQKVSSLGNGRYFIMVADPGKHEFKVKSEAEDALALEVEPDETQFAACSIKMGIMVGRPDIRPSTEEDFRKHPKLDLVDDDDMGPGVGSLRAADVAAALAGQPNTIASAPAVGGDAAPGDAAPVAATPSDTAPADTAPSNAAQTDAVPAEATPAAASETAPAPGEGEPAASATGSAAPADPASPPEAAQPDAAPAPQATPAQ